MTAALLVLAAVGTPSARAELPASLPREGLVAFWSGDGHARDTAGTNHGTLKNGATFAKGKVGKAFKFDGSNDYVYVGNTPAMRITGSQTIAMWIRPSRLAGSRQCPFAKSYGGEGAITIVPAGSMTYYYGTAGRDAEPYAHVVAKVGTLKAGRWTHIAAVRDLKARKLRWYVDGRLVATAAAPFPAARASSQPVYIGMGYAGRFMGLIDEIGVWKRALSGGEIAAMIHGFAPPYVTRLPLMDRVEAADGSLFQGTIRNKLYTVTAAFGKVDIPAEKVIGTVPIRSAATSRPASAPAQVRVRVVLVDGQVVSGALAGQKIELVMPGGSVLRIPPRSITQCGYRISDDKPRAPAPIAAAMVALRNGDRLALATKARLMLRFETDCGTVALSAGGLVKVAAADPKASRHRVVFAGGSTLTGALPDGPIALTLAMGQTIRVKREDILHLVGTGKPARIGQADTIVLKNGDRLVGRLAAKALTIRTTFGPARVATTTIASIAPEAKTLGAVTIRTWDAAALTGPLAEKAIGVSLGSGGPLVTVPFSAVASVVRSAPLPSPEITKTVMKLIARLGAESYTDRQAATKALKEMGPHIVPLLKRHLHSPDPEVRQRIEELIVASNPPPTPTRPRGGSDSWRFALSTDRGR